MFEKEAEEYRKENAELKADNDARKFAMAMSEKVEKQLREENAELEQENEKLKNRNAELKGMYAHSAREAGIYKQFLELKERENAELKEQNNKWFVFETDAGNWGMDKATQYTVDRHNYFYGTKEECQKWGVEHKIKDYTGHKYCYDRLDEQLTKAKEIIKDLLEHNKEHWLYSDIKKQAKQFLKEIEK